MVSADDNTSNTSEDLDEVRETRSMVALDKGWMCDVRARGNMEHTQQHTTQHIEHVLADSYRTCDGECRVCTYGLSTNSLTI